MNESDGLLLGRVTDYELPYSPSILQGLPRDPARLALGLGAEAALPFRGWDIWNAWEVSWLEPGGKPAIAWGEIRIPADSPKLVESKSLKLYLNSLNQRVFASAAEVAELVRTDLQQCVGAPVEVTLSPPAMWPLDVTQPRGVCVDALPLTVARYEPAPDLLTCRTDAVEETLYSRLLRSRCPVTGQPDWGTLLIAYRGPAIDQSGLLGYLVSYRQHQDFHEACVERIFMDLLTRCRPERLTVWARYLRRGGLDINPWRSNDPTAQPQNDRLFQQ